VANSVALPQGVLPNPVIRDPRSTGLFIFGQLDPTLSADGVKIWLQEVTGFLRSLREPDSNDGVQFDAAVGFGPSFFQAGTTPRFGLPTTTPAGLASPPQLPASFPVAPDFVIYAMSPKEEKLVQLTQWMLSCQPKPVTGLRVERGFQRASSRENFRFLDGMRNPGIGDRAAAALVGLDQMPDEPAWVEGAAYMVYMKIRQDLALAALLSDTGMEQAIGRRNDDGSRLDQQPGVAAKDESDYTDPTTPGVRSHVRKVGPRGAEQGSIAIFRRGLPFMDIAPDGSAEFGLHFVSFGDFDQFDTMLNRWMLNTVFPSDDAGQDALVAQHLIAFELAAVFIVPPADDRFVGAQIFDPEPKQAPGTTGRLVVRKRAVDAGGNPVRTHSLRGAVFQVLQGGNPVGEQLTTDAAGRAVSGDLSINVPYVLHEVTPLAGANPAADMPFTVGQRRQRITVDNVFGQAPHSYGS